MYRAVVRGRYLCQIQGDPQEQRRSARASKDKPGGPHVYLSVCQNITTLAIMRFTHRWPFGPCQCSLQLILLNQFIRCIDFDWMD